VNNEKERRTKLYRNINGNWVLMSEVGYYDDKVSYYKRKFGDNVLTEEEMKKVLEKKDVADKKKN